MDEYELLLVRAAQEGDKEAFRSLVARYERVLSYICRKCTDSFEDSQDALQRTLLEIWKGLPTFEARGSFKSWACRVAAIHAGRQGKEATRTRLLARVDTVRDEGDTDTVEPLDSDPSPEDVAVVSEFRSQLRTIRDSLPAPFRDVWIMRYEEELDYEVIAGVLGISEETARTRAFRARARMREALGQLAHPSPGDDADCE